MIHSSTGHLDSGHTTRLRPHSRGAPDTSGGGVGEGVAPDGVVCRLLPHPGPGHPKPRVPRCGLGFGVTWFL